MILTTVICSSGLSVFGASSFVPILHFAWLMVFLLVAALSATSFFCRPFSPALWAAVSGRVVRAPTARISRGHRRIQADRRRSPRPRGDDVQRRTAGQAGAQPPRAVRSRTGLSPGGASGLGGVDL